MRYGKVFSAINNGLRVGLQICSVLVNDVTQILTAIDQGDPHAAD
jgi:hypothetical protein